jgi:hypothetical protein
LLLLILVLCIDLVLLQFKFEGQILLVILHSILLLLEVCLLISLSTIINFYMHMVLQFLFFHYLVFELILAVSPFEYFAQSFLLATNNLFLKGVNFAKHFILIGSHWLLLVLLLNLFRFLLRCIYLLKDLNCFLLSQDLIYFLEFLIPLNWLLN